MRKEEYVAWQTIAISQQHIAQGYFLCAQLAYPDFDKLELEFGIPPSMKAIVEKFQKNNDRHECWRELVEVLNTMTKNLATFTHIMENARLVQLFSEKPQEELEEVRERINK